MKNSTRMNSNSLRLTICDITEYWVLFCTSNHAWKWILKVFQEWMWIALGHYPKALLQMWSLSASRKFSPPYTRNPLHTICVLNFRNENTEWLPHTAFICFIANQGTLTTLIYFKSNHSEHQWVISGWIKQNCTKKV